MAVGTDDSRKQRPFFTVAAAAAICVIALLRGLDIHGPVLVVSSVACAAVALIAAVAHLMPPTRSRRLLAWLGLLIVVSTPVGAAALFDSGGAPASHDPELRVTTKTLDELRVDRDVRLFVRVLGAPDLRQEAADLAKTAGGTDFTGWQIWSWEPSRNYSVTALLDRARAVRAYSLRSFSRAIRPVIPVFGQRLTEATFADLEQSPNNTGTTLSLFGREAATFANTTGPYYFEAYSVTNPLYQSVVVSAGGATAADPGGDWKPAVTHPTIFDLAAPPLDGAVDCTDAACQRPLPGSLISYRAKNFPNSFLLLSDGVSLDAARALLLY